MMSQENRNKITAIIIIIIILLLGGLLGGFIQGSFSSSQSGVKKQENNVFKQLKAVIMLPLYYVVEYPRMIRGISSGDYEYEYQGQEAPQTPQKQYVNMP